MTPLNPSLYNWTSPLPGIYRRPALSTEALWSTRPKELHEIFVTAKLTFSTPSTRVALRTAAVRAWRLLRFEVPELGLNVAVQDGEIFLEYRVIGEEGISDWMSRTFFFNNAGEGGKYGFEGLRGDICSRKEGEDMAGVLLDFNGLREEWNGDLGLIDSMYVILNVDHQVSDGIGTRILMGRFLDLFAWCVGDGVEDENLLVWEESGKNLSKPWIGMLDGKQKLEGGGFEEVAEKKKIYLYHEISPKTNPSLPLRKSTSIEPTNPETSTQKTHFHTFSQQETTSLLQIIKRINKQVNITHAVHAAMVLALLNQSQSEHLTFNSSCWLNGRRYLLPSEKNHIPLCQTFFPIQFTNLENLRPGKEAGSKERREAMVKTMEMAMEQYMMLKGEGEKGLVLGSMVSTGEEIGRVLRGRASGKEKGEVKEKKGGAVPLFLSDGITEGYISRSYPRKGDENQKEDQGREPVFEVEDIYFGANAGGEVILRIATFRSQLRISVEWKEELFDGEMVRGFLEEVRTLLMSLL